MKNTYDDPPAMSWGELANLTHETQVQIFGWCPCEDNDKQKARCNHCEAEFAELDIRVVNDIEVCPICGKDGALMDIDNDMPYDDCPPAGEPRTR